MKEPRDIIKKILDYKKDGTVLDMGAGFGRNAIFLAQQGFQVTAVELNDKPLQNLQKNAEENKVTIKTIQSDIKDFKSSEKFDVVISTMVLHFLSRDEIVSTIQNMKALTNPNGLNVISAYTDKNINNLRPYMFKSGELKEFYEDWEVSFYEEIGYVAEEEDIKDCGPKERFVVELIAINKKTA